MICKLTFDSWLTIIDVAENQKNKGLFFLKLEVQISSKFSNDNEKNNKVKCLKMEKYINNNLKYWRQILGFISVLYSA